MEKVIAKSRIYLLTYLLVGIAALFFLTACEEKHSPKSTANQSAVLDNIIEWHTQGIVSKDSTIRIRFKNAVIDQTKVGQSASVIFSIQPEVAGKALFKSTKEIVFIPDQPLTPAEKYTVILQPNTLKAISAASSPFSFSFQIIPLEHKI